MGSLFLQSVTEPLRVSCTILAFIIPYVIYKINLKLHEYGDPPWKKEDTKKANENH